MNKVRGGILPPIGAKLTYLSCQSSCVICLYSSIFSNFKRCSKQDKGEKICVWMSAAWFITILALRFVLKVFNVLFSKLLWLLAECSEGNTHFTGFMHTCKVSSSPAARVLGYAVDRDYQRSSPAVLSLSTYDGVSTWSEMRGRDFRIESWRARNNEKNEFNLIKGTVCKPEESYVNGSVIKVL